MHWVLLPQAPPLFIKCIDWRIPIHHHSWWRQIHHAWLFACPQRIMVEAQGKIKHTCSFIFTKSLWFCLNSTDLRIVKNFIEFCETFFLHWHDKSPVVNWKRFLISVISIFMSSTARFIEESRCSDNYNNRTIFTQNLLYFPRYIAWRFMKRNKLIKIFAVWWLPHNPFHLTLATAAEANSKLKIVVTTFPEYDWVRDSWATESGDIDAKATSREWYWFASFQPSAQDIKGLISQMLTFSSMLAVRSDEWVWGRPQEEEKEPGTSLQSTSWMKWGRKRRLKSPRKVCSQREGRWRRRGDGHHHETPRK